MSNNDPKLGEKIASVPVASDKALPSKRGGGNSSKNSMAPADGMSFISVNAGNSRIKWSFHKPTDWLPYLFWETCHLQQNDTNVTAPDTNAPSETSTLVEYLPPIVCNYIFGNDQSFSFEAAKHNLLSEAKSTTNFTKEKALLRIYIVSSSMEQTRLLQEQWHRTCPCIVHVLQNSTFCLPSQQNVLPYYEGMGTDRVAAVTGARFLYGLPTLVFDAGTALTYTALDANGNILGGGIGAGIQLSLTSLHKATSGNLPHISLIEQQQKQQIECNLFETNTKGAILTATLEQTLTWVRQVIAGWLHLVGERQNQHSNASVNSTTDVHTVAEYVSSIISGDVKQHKCNNDRNVVFTGGDGKLLQTLLTTRMSSISRPNCGDAAGHDINDKSKNVDSIYTKLLKLNNSIMASCSTACEDHLIHLGIAYTLLLQSTKKVHNINIPPKDELQNNIVGGQVAKKIRIRSNDHKNTKYLFGRVIELYEALAEKESKEMATKFIVSFDDGSRDIVNLEELNDMLQAFIRVHHRKGIEEQAESGEKIFKRKHLHESPSTSEADTAECSNSMKSRDKRRAGEISSPVSKKIRGKKANADRFGSAHDFVGQRVAKYFDGVLYFGSITNAFPDAEAECGLYFHAKYDDGDSEDYDKSELMESLALYGKKKAKDRNAPASKALRKGGTSDNGLFDDLVSFRGA